MKIIEREYDIVVVGGGISGVCAAIASARNGAKTVLINNRPVLGGNASSEIRMHICGATYHGKRKDARESGILEEILLENKMRNPQFSYSEFDRIIWEKVRFQENLDLVLNTHISEVETNIDSNGLIRVVSVSGVQNTTEKKLNIKGKIFIDTTGDASISAKAGAECLIGREGKDVYGEKYAPDKSDSVTMGNTLLFNTKRMDKPVSFEKPHWANTYTEDDLFNRGHGASGENYWWIELGGDDLNTIDDAEEIRDELLKAVYGVWDHIKNGADHGADNYALDWVGFLPGKRESRRILGDYVLKEQDLFNSTVFEDAIAYGGWPMDMHVAGGLKTRKEPTDFIWMEDVYSVPYRSIYSKKHSNLYVGGRAISTSHMAFGSTRIMGTCAVVGQAAGTAAAMCCEKNCDVRAIKDSMRDLQNRLLRDDAYIPGFMDECNNNIAKEAKIIASSERVDGCANNVVNGVARPVHEEFNGWKSATCNNEWIDLTWEEGREISELRLTLDSNLSSEIMLTMFDNGLKNRESGVPKELLKDFEIQFLMGEDIIKKIYIENNHQRLNVIKLEDKIIVDKIKIKIMGTNGLDHCRILEIKVY